MSHSQVSPKKPQVRRFLTLLDDDLYPLPPSADGQSPTSSLLITIEQLQSAIKELSSLYSQLKSSIESLEKRFDALSATSSTPLVSPPSRQSSSAILTTVLRRRQVFLRGIPEEGDDYDLMAFLRKELVFDHYMKFYRLPSKTPSPSPRPIIITFYSPEDADMFISQLYRIKKKGGEALANTMARINYDKEDLEEHRRLWKEAISLNDKAGSRVAVVRGLSLVRLPTPGEWSVRPRQSPLLQFPEPVTTPPPQSPPPVPFPLILLEYSNFASLVCPLPCVSHFNILLHNPFVNQ